MLSLPLTHTLFLSIALSVSLSPFTWGKMGYQNYWRAFEIGQKLTCSRQIIKLAVIKLTVFFVHVFKISQFHLVVNYIEIDASITSLLKFGKLGRKLKQKKLLI